MNLSLSPDAVQEFQVQTGSYSAELGGAGGGQVNIVTRQGGSRFHGTGYEFLRIMRSTRAPGTRCPNQPPGAEQLRRLDRWSAFGKQTFFFANYEGFRQTQAQTAMDTVPADTESLGDFSASGATIFDPSTPTANPNYNPRCR